MAAADRRTFWRERRRRLLLAFGFSTAKVLRETQPHQRQSLARTAHQAHAAGEGEAER